MPRKTVKIELDREAVEVEIDDRTIEVDPAEIVALYNLLEKINHLMHQPLYYRDAELMDRHARRLYPEIRRFYYDVLWNLLPKPVQARIDACE